MPYNWFRLLSIDPLYFKPAIYVSVPSGHAIWGLGLDRLDAETVGLNPA
jgi:hypothetical protein